MAATRLSVMHANKGKSIAKCLKERTDYAMNEEKTEQGRYISSYACNAEMADKEFAQSKKNILNGPAELPKGISLQTRFGSHLSLKRSHRKRQIR